jgi:hypothetical protein
MEMRIAAAAAAAALTLSPAAGANELAHYRVEGRASVHRATPLNGYETHARVAYLYTRGEEIDRHKHVDSFQHPSTGVYCIHPSIPVNLSHLFPNVTVEYNYSVATAMLAYFRDVDAFSNCPFGYLEVDTYDFDAGGAPVLSNKVAFDITL